MDVVVLARLTIAEYHQELLDLFEAIPRDMLTANERRMVQRSER